MVLKRRTTQNIVWGGLAGCFPTLIGWTAVTGELAWPPVVLFLVVFFWTPPHTWALAMRYREDYARVDVPMLPVVKDAEGVARQIVAYSWVMVAVSLTLWPVADTGLLYPVVATVLGRRVPGRGPPDVAARPAQQRARRWCGRCGCSTGPTCTSRCCSSPSRWTRCSRAERGPPVGPSYEVGEAEREDRTDQQDPVPGSGASSATAQTRATATTAGTIVLGISSARLCSPDTISR